MKYSSQERYPVLFVMTLLDGLIGHLLCFELPPPFAPVRGGAGGLVDEFLNGLEIKQTSNGNE